MVCIRLYIHENMICDCQNSRKKMESFNNADYPGIYVFDSSKSNLSKLTTTYYNDMLLITPSLFSIPQQNGKKGTLIDSSCLSVCLSVRPYVSHSHFFPKVSIKTILLKLGKQMYSVNRIKILNKNKFLNNTFWGSPYLELELNFFNPQVREGYVWKGF